MTDIVLFTDHVTFVIASTIALVFAVLLVSKESSDTSSALNLEFGK